MVPAGAPEFPLPEAAVCPEPEMAAVVPGALVLAVPEPDGVADEPALLAELELVELEALELVAPAEGELADEAVLADGFELAVGDAAEAAGVAVVVFERLVPPHPARANTSRVEQNADAQELVCNFGVIYHPVVAS